MAISHRTLRLMRALSAVGAIALASAASGCGSRMAPAAKSAGVLVLPEYYAHSIAALGFPGMRRAFQVGHGSQIGAGDGAFEWGLATDEPVTVSPVFFEADGVPVAHWWMVSPRDSVCFEAAALAVPGATDTLLVASVRATVLTRSGTPSSTPLRLVAHEELVGPHFRPWDSEPAPGATWRWDGGLAERAGMIVGALGDAAGWQTRTAAGGNEALAATSRASGNVFEFWFPDRPVAPAEAARIAKHLRHDEHASRTRVAWRAWLDRGAPLATPDSLVNQAWRAALVTVLQGHERSRGGWVPMGNPFQYRDTWLRDGARVVRALAIAGYTDLAREDALTLGRYELPNGALLSQPGQLDGAGEALWAFEQAAGCPPSAEWSKRLLPVAARAGEWLRTQRALTADLAHTIRVDWPGLLPYGDPHDGELVCSPLVGNDAWAIAGQFALAAMAGRAGDAKARDAAHSEGEAHRAAFLSALALTRHPDVPPAWPGSGRDWGNCSVGYPTRVLAADDPRLAHLAGRIWGASGLHMATYSSADSLHSYLGTDFAVWALLAGRPADARAALHELLVHSSSTLGQAEMFSRSSRDFGDNLPPHGTAAAQLVDLVRSMIVLDARDTLEIAAGADLSWWRGTRLLHAPTRFGIVDVTLSSPAAGRLVAHWSHVGVPVRIRVPDGVRLDGVQGASARAAGTRWVECAAAGDSVVLRVTPS